ncbi:hypothetical protein ES703_55258 [subsurface metagenome]
MDHKDILGIEDPGEFFLDAGIDIGTAAIQMAKVDRAAPEPAGNSKSLLFFFCQVLMDIRIFSYFLSEVRSDIAYMLDAMHVNGIGIVPVCTESFTIGFELCLTIPPR